MNNPGMPLRGWLWLECLAVFAGLPALLWLGLIPVPVVSIPLIVVTIPAAIWLAGRYGFSVDLFWLGDRQRERKYISVVMLRFAVTGLLLLIIVWWFFPERLFDLPRQTPVFWLFFVLLYPVLSVYPQELLFRAFFFRRYISLLQNRWLLILVNAIFFSWMHIVFDSAVALLYTFVGGLYFAHTYQKTGSLRLVCLEHSLYGILLVSIGHGRDLLTSTVISRLAL